MRLFFDSATGRLKGMGDSRVDFSDSLVYVLDDADPRVGQIREGAAATAAVVSGAIAAISVPGPPYHPDSALDLAIQAALNDAVVPASLKSVLRELGKALS